MTNALQLAITDLDAHDLGAGRFTFRTESLETAQKFYIIVTRERMEGFGRYGATLPIGRARSVAYRELVRDALRLPQWWSLEKRTAVRCSHIDYTSHVLPLNDSWCERCYTHKRITVDLQIGEEIAA